MPRSRCRIITTIDPAGPMNPLRIYAQISGPFVFKRTFAMTEYKYRTSFTYNGKRYWIRANTKADLEVKKAMKLRDLEEGKIVPNCNTTLKQWAEQCIETYKTNQSDITRRK